MPNNILDDHAPKRQALQQFKTLGKEIFTLYKAAIVTLLF